MSRLWIIISLLISCFAGAQDKSAKPAVTPGAPPPGVTVSDPIYPLPIEVRSPVRDLQAEWDEVEIDSQKMLVEIEQRKVLIEKNKAKQEELIKKMQKIAASYAVSNHIDLDAYDLDPKELKFTKRKAAKP